jgi:nucleoside-diphosphate-sugar epimerase
MKIVVVGANGFVGTSICAALEEVPKYSLIKAVRGDDLEEKLASANVIIHSANPAGRFKAESYQHQDFLDTVEKTSSILSSSKNKKIILISSLSCRTQLHTSYGRNRRSCELLTLSFGGVVIRLGPMFGGDRKQDVLHDLLASRKIYVSPDTKYGYTNIEWIGQEIIKYLDMKSGIYEIGASNSVSLNDLREYFESDSDFEGEDDTQIPRPIPGRDSPNAKLVFEYAKQELLNIDTWK